MPEPTFTDLCTPITSTVRPIERTKENEFLFDWERSPEALADLREIERALRIPQWLRDMRFD